jgi:CheY-like chemotaxis protein
MKKWRILVVDDEQDIALVIKRGLEQAGFDVETFTSPKQALDGYKPGQYDLLLLDINMPEMNGFELFRNIKKKDGKVKVCFITAFEIYYDEFRRVFPKLHVNCFIRKPATIAELAKAVHEELARKDKDKITLPPQHEKHYGREI